MGKVGFFPKTKARRPKLLLLQVKDGLNSNLGGVYSNLENVLQVVMRQEASKTSPLSYILPTRIDTLKLKLSILFVDKKLN